MVGLVGFILCFPFLNNLPCQGSLKEVLQWARNVSPQCMLCTGKELKSSLYCTFFIFVSAFNVIMSPVLGFGGKCTCCFNISMLNLTLCGCFGLFALLFEEKGHGSLQHENHKRQKKRERNPRWK